MTVFKQNSGINEPIGPIRSVSGISDNIKAISSFFSEAFLQKTWLNDRDEKE